jgi:hypothetical protein
MKKGGMRYDIVGNPPYCPAVDADAGIEQSEGVLDILYCCIAVLWNETWV